MPCENCGNPLPLKEFLASLFYKDGNGNVGINLTNLCIDDCQELTPVVQCGQPFDLGELFRMACSLDDCDNPSLNVFINTCERPE